MSAELAGLVGLGSDFADALQHGAYFSQNAERLVGALWKIEAFVDAEQAVDEAVEFLATHQRERRQPLARSRDLDAGQAEWRRAFLVTAEPVPQAHHQRTDQLVGGVQLSNAAIRRPTAPPPSPSAADCMAGVAMLPRKRVRTAWNGTGHW